MQMVRDLIDISNLLNLPLWEVKQIVNLLHERDLISF